MYMQFLISYSLKAFLCLGLLALLKHLLNYILNSRALLSGSSLAALSKAAMMSIVGAALGVTAKFNPRASTSISLSISGRALKFFYDLITVESDSLISGPISLWNFLICLVLVVLAILVISSSTRFSTNDKSSSVALLHSSSLILLACLMSHLCIHLGLVSGDPFSDKGTFCADPDYVCFRGSSQLVGVP